MALGGTLLPSISTFASGPTIKSKSIGNANLVSILWSLHIMRLPKKIALCGVKNKNKKSIKELGAVYF